jgi:hypothetical protein
LTDPYDHGDPEPPTFRNGDTAVWDPVTGQFHRLVTADGQPVGTQATGAAAMYPRSDTHAGHYVVMHTTIPASALQPLPAPGEPGTVWETCAGCQREYAYPHLCRTHLLCGFCHPDDEETPAP